MRGVSKILKIRNVDLRKAFYMPALIFMRLSLTVIQKY